MTWTLDDVQTLPRDVYGVIVEEMNKAASKERQ